MKSKSLDLVVIGGSVFQWGGDGLTTKYSVVSYVRELSMRFRKVTWIASLDRDKAFTKTAVSAPSILAVPVSNSWCAMWQNFRVLSGIITSRTVVLMFLPSYWLILPVLLNKWRAKGLFVYLANDYEAYSRTLRNRGKYLKSLMNRILHELPTRYADGVIARGNVLVSVASNLNTNVIQSHAIDLCRQPIVSRSVAPCSTHRVNLTYVGRLISGKGIFLLLEALADLQVNMPDLAFHLLVVGDGELAPIVDSRIGELNLQQSVTRRGYVDDPTELSGIYSRTDILVVPTIDFPEGLPRVIDEAIVHGALVVASAIGSIPIDYVQGEVLTFPATDRNALAAAIAAILRDETLRRDMTRRVTQRAQKIAKQQPTAIQHLNFIEQTIS